MFTGNHRAPGPRSIAAGAIGAAMVAAVLAAPASAGPPVAHQAVTPDPGAQLAASRAAALAADSMFVHGSTPLNRTTFTVRLTRDHRAHMRLREGTAGRLQVIRIGRRAFSLANAAFYRAHGLSAAAARERAGRWFLTPSPLIAADLLDKQFLVGRSLTPTGAVRISGTATIDGRAVTLFRDADENGTIAVRSTGVPYPVSIDYDAKDQGIVGFSKWNEKTTIVAPKRFSTSTG